MCLRFILLSCILALGLCGFRAPPPDRTSPPPSGQPPRSVVSATLKVSGADLVAMLNERTRSQLAHIENEEVNCFIQKCQIDLTAVRTGEITGYATGAG